MRPEADTSSEGPLWQGLLAHREAYTCYSAALASWAAFEYVVVGAPGEHRAHPAARRGRRGAVRVRPLSTCAASRGAARADRRRRPGRRSGGDPRGARSRREGDRRGRRLPASLARRCRPPPRAALVRRLGNSRAAARGRPVRSAETISASRRRRCPSHRPRRARRRLARAHPADSDVVDLRGVVRPGRRRVAPSSARTIQWFVRGEVDRPAARRDVGPGGDTARLARHFRDNGEEADAYRQVDDIWSIARHRAFLFQIAADEATRSEAIAAWVDEHVAPLAKRWSHMAPLLFQAVLAIGPADSRPGASRRRSTSSPSVKRRPRRLPARGAPAPRSVSQGRWCGLP